jgi:two-component system chemotaxis response regulator CheB
MSGHDIVAIGASAGGVQALQGLISQLPGDLPAALLIVLHISPDAPSILPNLLNRQGRLLALHATDGAPIRPGCIYIAPPDMHLMTQENHVRVVRGPKENRHRPAIDVLFRSVALSYGPRAVGVVLSGSLDDGTAGLLAIKRRGGVTVVQTPAEAAYSGMPESALAGAPVDYCLPLEGIAQLIRQLAASPAAAAPEAPAEMAKELATMAVDVHRMENDEHPGRPSVYSCPECGGVLWEIEDQQITRYRCRVGHAFSLDSILEEQSESVERALWMVLKTLEERASMLRRMMERASQRAHMATLNRFATQLSEAEAQAQVVRNVLTRDWRAPEPAEVTQ